MQSTVDWCESNYTNSKYIAEYWNSITGIFLIFSGVLFNNLNINLILKNNVYIQKNFENIYYLLIYVGIGTILFHSTLLYAFQLLDEIPMIFLAREYITILLNLNIVTNTININLLNQMYNIIYIIPTLSIFISLSYFININLQIITFHITLKITEISLIFLLYNLSYKLNKLSYDIIYKKHFNNHNTKNTSFLSSSSFVYNNKSLNDTKHELLLNVQQDILKYIKIKKDISNLIRSALTYYGISVSLWVIENIFCDYIYFLQLHSVWHILSSIGIYKLNKIILNYTLIDRLLYSLQDTNINSNNTNVNDTDKKND